MSEIHENKRSSIKNQSDYNNSPSNSQADYEDPEEESDPSADQNDAPPAQQHFAANPVAPEAPKEEIKAPPGPVSIKILKLVILNQKSRHF